MTYEGASRLWHYISRFASVEISARFANGGGSAAPAATITLVADKALIPVSKLLGQRGEDRLAIAGVFAPLLLVEADNVATILDFDFFELQRGRILGPFALGGDFDPWRIAFEITCRPTVPIPNPQRRCRPLCVNPRAVRIKALFRLAQLIIHLPCVRISSESFSSVVKVGSLPVTGVVQKRYARLQ
jgi:hypothetical protein